MPVSLQLGIDKLIVEADFKTTSIRRYQRERLNFGFELFEQLSH